MLEGAERRTSMCQAFYRTFLCSRGIYRSSQEQFLNANFVWNQDEVSQVDSLALRQCNTSLIPDTHSLKLLFPTRYTSRSIYQSFMCDSQLA